MARNKPTLKLQIVSTDCQVLLRIIYGYLFLGVYELYTIQLVTLTTNYFKLLNDYYLQYNTYTV